MERRHPAGKDCEQSKKLSLHSNLDLLETLLRAFAFNAVGMTAFPA